MTFQDIESKWKESGLSDMLLAKFKTLLTDDSEEGIKPCIELLRSFGDEGLCVVLKQEGTGQMLLRDDLGIIHRLLWMAEVIAVITEEGSVWSGLYESGAFDVMELQVLDTVDWVDLSEVQQKNIISFSMSCVEVPAGNFLMGALPDDIEAFDDEIPQHLVTLTKGILVGLYQCTQGLYESVMECIPSMMEGVCRPVEHVSWCDAVLFCNKLSKREGLEPVYTIPDGLEEACRNQIDSRDSTVDALSMHVVWNRQCNGYRLPTEAEWEYCARGGESHLYAGSDEIDEVCWYDGNSQKTSRPVGVKKANGFGLYDMSGNVWEWIWDTAVEDEKDQLTGECLYSGALRINPVYEIQIGTRMSRGGSWFFKAMSTRSSIRNREAASYRTDIQGFRLFRNA